MVRWHYLLIGSEFVRVIQSSVLIDRLQSSAGTQIASGTSEQRWGADLSSVSGGKDAGRKSGSESLLDSVKKSVHKRGEGEHSRAV
jgi:hypothetical protein